MYFFNSSSLESALLHYGKLDEVQDALENDHDVFSLWNFEDKLLSKAIKAGNTVKMKSILRKALRGEDVKLVLLGGSNSTGTGGCFGADEKSLDGFYFRVQGRSQTSEQDEASFERRRRKQLGGSGGMPSPPSR